MRELNAGCAFAAALCDELERGGVRHAVISPGSRSALLALTFAASEGIADYSVLDERSAGFFALGLARATCEPVALVCTSGTAAANYLPAVVEAHYARVPLLVLSADRPPELRDCGAGQTIDQTRLYGDYVRLFAEWPTPLADEFALRSVRTLACRALAASRGPIPGPVQLNLPFREPLAPQRVEAEAETLGSLSELARLGRGSEAFTRVAPAAASRADEDTLERVSAALGRHARGWIVAGPTDADDATREQIAQLAERCGWALFAEPLSQVAHPTLGVDMRDALFRCEAFAETNAPSCVLRFGAMPTSKAYRLLLERHPEIEQIVVDPDAWNEPTALSTELVRSHPGSFAADLAARISPRAADAFALRWIDAGRRARATLERELAAEGELSEPGIVRALAQGVPEGAQLFCASSMPVRDVDLVWPTDSGVTRVLANRGANGIDGTLSCALGHAAGSDAATLLLCGDLALLHDVGSLALARRLDPPLTVVIVDNDGGGIFEMLPVAERAPRDAFARHFSTPHGLDLGDVVRGFGVPCTEVGDAKDLRACVERALAARRFEVIVARTDRQRNVAARRELIDAVRVALEEPSA